MTTGPNKFIRDIDLASNYEGHSSFLRNDQEAVVYGSFEHHVLKAVANLFGGNRPVHDVLSEVYSELHRIENNGGTA